MDLRNLLLRLIFGAVLAILGLVVSQWRMPQQLVNLKPRQFDFFYFAIFFASHFLIFFAAFFLLHQKPHADLPTFYVPEAHSAMQGLVPYRDFRSSYAPLNS